jgi:hypothetical protein
MRLLRVWQTTTNESNVVLKYCDVATNGLEMKKPWEIRSTMGLSSAKRIYDMKGVFGGTVYRYQGPVCDAGSPT